MKSLLFGLFVAFFYQTSFAQADYKLTIMHTNDIHARFEPVSESDNGYPKCGEKGLRFGGYARLSSKVKEIRNGVKNSILVDGGDQFNGSILFEYYKGKLIAEMMNKIGYDAMVVGNHEFHFGLKNLRDFGNAVRFPLLLANTNLSDEPLLNDIISKTSVIDKGGQKIGLIGLTTSVHVHPKIGNNLKILDPIRIAALEINKLKRQGINKILLISHVGFDVNKIIAAQTDGIDVIISGHSNTILSNKSNPSDGPYPTMIKNTAIIQVADCGKFLGALNVIFNDKGELMEASGDPIFMDQNIEEDMNIKKIIDQKIIPTKEKMFVIKYNLKRVLIQIRNTSKKVLFRLRELFLP